MCTVALALRLLPTAVRLTVRSLVTLDSILPRPSSLEAVASILSESHPVMLISPEALINTIPPFARGTITGSDCAESSRSLGARGAGAGLGVGDLLGGRGV